MSIGRGGNFPGGILQWDSTLQAYRWSTPADPGAVAGQLLGWNGTDFEWVDSPVITEPDPTLAAAKALAIGARYGEVVLAPLGTSDWARVASVYLACDGKYNLTLANGSWDFTGAPSFTLVGTDGTFAQDILSGSTVVTTTQPTRINQARGGTTTIMLCGDSITAGGDSSMGDSVLAWRGHFWQELRQRRGGIRFIGSTLNGLFDNRSAVPGATPPGNVSLGDWHASATGGNTLAAIIAQNAADEAIYGFADVYVLLGGENDIKAGVIAMDPPATIAATVLAGIDAWIAARIAANPLAHLFVLDLTPHGMGLANYTDYDGARALINTALPAHLATLGHSNLHFVAAGSLLTKAHISADGEHPNHAGMAIIAKSVANDVLRTIGVSGLPHPRKVLQRMAVPRLSTANDFPATGYITETGTALNPLGTESVSIGMLYIPDGLGASDSVWARNLFYVGQWDVPDLLVRHNKSFAGSAVANCIEIYIDVGAGLVSAFAPNDCLRLNGVHKIGIGIDNVKHELSVYCLRAGIDGRPVTSLVSQVNFAGSITWKDPTAGVGGGIRLGGYGGGGLAYSATGIKGDFWIARHKVITEEDMLAWYYEGLLPEGTTAHYPLNEGAGTTTAPGPGFGALLPTGTVTNGWSAASAVAEPWHRYADGA